LLDSLLQERMADQDLSELLTEFKNLAESEHHSFLNTIVNNLSHASTIFGALTLFEDRPKPSDLLQPLCDLLLTIYRNNEIEFRQFSLQFLPNLAYLYLQNHSDRNSYHCIETLLVAIHNIEVGEETGKSKSFKVPSLSTSSIYHDSSLISESRIFAVPDVGLERGLSCSNVSKPVVHQVTNINAQNRNRIMSQLFGIYTSLLGEFSKQSLDWSCKVCSRMVTRGFNINKKTHSRNRSYGSESGLRSPRAYVTRISLCPTVLLEMVHLAYFSIFNGYGSVGTQLARDVEFRGRHGSLANVLLVSRAVLQLATRATGSVEAPHIATPSQLTKNMITNASFRTKKLEGDIPRIETEEDAANGERMGVISEEAETEMDRANRVKDNEAVVDGGDKVNIADKIKAKLETARDNVRIPTRKKEKERDKEKERGVSESSDKEDKNKINEKKEKKSKDRQRSEVKNSFMADHDFSSEEYIRMNTLPSETIAIHSPESGSTTLH